MTSTGFTFAFPVQILIWIAVPLILAFTYRHFYNAHANRVLANDTHTDDVPAKDARTGSVPADDAPARRWLSPFIVFLISLFAEILITAILGMTFSISTEDSTGDSQAAVEIRAMSQEEVDDSAYVCFDGSEVNGFTLTDESTGDFTCDLYRSDADQLLPQYIFRVEYTGSAPVISWAGGVDTEDGSEAALMDFTDGQPRVMYLMVDTPSEDIGLECFLKVYDLTHEEVGQSDEEPEPVSEFRMVLQ